MISASDNLRRSKGSTKWCDLSSQGYDKLVLRAQEDGEEVLYFEKTLLFSMDENA